MNDAESAYWNTEISDKDLESAIKIGEELILYGYMKGYGKDQWEEHFKILGWSRYL